MAYNSTYDLLGKKVSDTYPSLLQSGSDGALYDGRGNSVTINATIPHIYATTGSNIFRGDQTITGSIYMDAPGTDSIYFSQSGPAGRLVWNEVDGTLDLGLKGNNVTLQIGQEEVVRVVNKTGTDLTEAGYQAVRLDGAQGNRLKVALAKGDADGNSLDTLGLVTENIANNQEGFVTVSGLVRGINTTGNLQGESWADGDALYLSPTSFGGLTKFPPTAPSHSVRMGYVVQSNPSNGSIYVKVDNGYELDELHNVAINTASLSPGQLLVRDGLVWYNTNQLTGSYFVTGSIQAISFTGSLSGTGSWAVSASQAISSSYADRSQTTSTITINSFGSNVDSYLLMSNVVATPGVAIGGDADLRYNASTNRLTVGSISANSLTASLQGTASWADNATSASYVLNAISSSFASTASFAPDYLLVGSTSSMLAPYVLNSQTGSFTLTSSFNSFTASYTTASFTGSFTGSLFGTASWAVSASQAISSSFARTATTSSISLSPISVAGSTIYSTIPSTGNASSNNGIFLGSSAGGGATSANLSIFLGYLAGQLATNANESIIVGPAAGLEATKADHSVFVGSGAGYKAVSASYSIVVGSYAGSAGDASPSTTSVGTNNILIGNYVTLPSKARDSVNIGGIIFATGSYSTMGTVYSGSQYGIGKVGINIVTPQYTLDVSGSGNYSNGLVVTGSLIAPSITGSLQGTASWADNAVTASYADTLDGINSTQFARVDTNNNFSGVNTTTQKTIRTDGAYEIAETLYASLDILPDTQSLDLFNVYDYVTYTKDKAFENTSLIFDYTIINDTGTSIRSGRINLNWSPDNAGTDTMIDSQTITDPTTSGYITFGYSVDYAVGNESVRLNVLNDSTYSLTTILIRGFLRII